MTPAEEAVQYALNCLDRLGSWCHDPALSARIAAARSHLIGADASTESMASRCDVRDWEVDDGDTRCQDCGHAYSPWVTDNPLWNQVIGGDGTTSDPGGHLCPACFMRHTETVHGQITWRVVPMWKAGR